MANSQWDDAFDNMGHIPDSASLPAFWAERAARYRREANKNNRKLETDITYGKQAREIMDLVWPDSSPKGLLVFVHGGYWIRLDKSYWTDLAEGARSNGWAVCLPSYTLAPEARISEISRQIRSAIIKASELAPGPIRLAGHSAGGHLVSRMLCDDIKLPENVVRRIQHTVSISGLHDLRPLQNTKMNKTLLLDDTEATAESPALRKPMDNSSITAWVGGNERPEFIRQAQLLAMMWQGLGANISCHVVPQQNHFTVIEGLKDKNSAITKEVLRVVS